MLFVFDASNSFPSDDGGNRFKRNYYNKMYLSRSGKRANAKTLYDIEERKRIQTRVREEAVYLKVCYASKEHKAFMEFATSQIDTFKKSDIVDMLLCQNGIYAVRLFELNTKMLVYLLKRFDNSDVMNILSLNYRMLDKSLAEKDPISLMKLLDRFNNSDIMKMLSRPVVAFNLAFHNAEVFIDFLNRFDNSEVINILSLRYEKVALLLARYAPNSFIRFVNCRNFTNEQLEKINQLTNYRNFATSELKKIIDEEKLCELLKIVRPINSTFWEE